MAGSDELDWIAVKAAELLDDKVMDGPLSDKDIKLAFEMFARPRLQKLSFASEFERKQAEDQIMMRLEERAKQLNAERWQKEAF